MNWFKIFVVAVCASSLAQSSFAAPIPPVAIMTIEGRIQKVSWQPDKHHTQSSERQQISKTEYEN